MYWVWRVFAVCLTMAFTETISSDSLKIELLKMFSLFLLDNAVVVLLCSCLLRNVNLLLFFFVPLFLFCIFFSGPSNNQEEPLMFDEGKIRSTHDICVAHLEEKAKLGKPDRVQCIHSIFCCMFYPIM